MKTIYKTLFFVLTVIFLSCSGPNQQTDVVATTNVELSVEGMVCAVGCAKGIEEKMSGIAGIIACNVDFEKNEANIKFDNSLLSEDDISRHIEQMNEGQYKVKIITVEELNPKSESSDPEVGGGADPVSVRENSFSFPQLLTYFMNNL